MSNEIMVLSVENFKLIKEDSNMTKAHTKLGIEVLASEHLGDKVVWFESHEAGHKFVELLGKIMLDRYLLHLSAEEKVNLAANLANYNNDFELDCQFKLEKKDD